MCVCVGGGGHQPPLDFMDPGTGRSVLFSGWSVSPLEGCSQTVPSPRGNLRELEGSCTVSLCWLLFTSKAKLLSYELFDQAYSCIKPFLCLIFLL